MPKRAIVFCVVCNLLLLGAPRSNAQERGAAALGELVEGLGTTARVLVIGAHPDDEDTRLIAWLATVATSRRRTSRSRAATADRISSATSSAPSSA